MSEIHKLNAAVEKRNKRIAELEAEMDKMITDDIAHRNIIRDMEARLEAREQPPPVGTDKGEL